MIKWILTAWFVVAAGALAAPMALAQNLAVIIANDSYGNFPRVQGGRAIADLERDFQTAGFELVVLRDSRSLSAQDSDRLWRRMNRAERLVAVLSGRFVRSGGRHWLLNPDAATPNAFNIGEFAFPVDAVLAIASGKPGAALVALASDDSDAELGFGTAKSRRNPTVPQGVTLISGTPRQISDFISGAVLRPGTVLRDAARNAPDGFVIRGFLPRNQGFLPAGFGADDDGQAERAFWQQMRNQNDLPGYERYLRRYPNGLFAAQARERVQSLRLTPQQRAQAAEDSLNLTRNQRRAIQRNLSLLGVDTGGIDGIFGRRTRAAIASWQQGIGVPPTGYLNANQISRIGNDAAIRAAELRAEAERRRLAEERRDRRYWNQTGEGGTEDGLRAYLQRYPDGLFSNQAAEQLKAIEREHRRQARAAEREAWNAAVIKGTLGSYREYLRLYPDGLFAEEAQARIARLTNPETPQDLIDAAKREEAALNLNGLTRQLIESGLKNNNLDPGPVDGRFDNKTRRALRRFQRANGLTVTGFVTQDTIVRLLVSAVDQ